SPNRYASLAPNLDSARLIATSVTWVAACIIYSVPRRRGRQLQSVIPFLADFARNPAEYLRLFVYGWSAPCRAQNGLFCPVGFFWRGAKAGPPCYRFGGAACRCG